MLAMNMSLVIYVCDHHVWFVSACLLRLLNVNMMTDANNTPLRVLHQLVGNEVFYELYVNVVIMFLFCFYKHVCLFMLM